MSSVKVSIIVPVYNVEEYLSECLESCINQTLQDIEIICVNDGSSDNSLEILKEYADKDRRVKIIDKDNAGYGHTINIGIDMASGEYIAIVESDDFVKLDMYEKLYDLAFFNEVDFIKSDFYRFVYDNKNNINTDLIKVAARAPDIYNKVVNPKYDARVFHLVMQTWSGIYKRKYLMFYNIRHNETPGASYQDNGFWFQTLMYAERVFFYNEPFYMNRRDNPNSSVYNKEKVYCMHDEYKYIKHILDKNPQSYDLFKYQYTRKKFLNFLFTYNRIGEEFKLDYLFAIRNDLQEAINNSEIDWDDFDERDRENLELILDNPNKFYLESMKRYMFKEQYLEISSLKEKLDAKKYDDYYIERLEHQVELVSAEKEQCSRNLYNLLTSDVHSNNIKDLNFFDNANKGRNIKNHRVHLAFITDENYVMPTSVALTSLKMNKNETTEYIIHILVNNISDESKSKLLMLNAENFKINLLPVNVDEKFSNLTKKDGDLHVSPSALIKLRLPNILKKIGKVLYLDGDIIIQDDLLDLYNTNINGYYAGVVKDIISERNPNHMKNMGIKHKYYFNSGMMLLNLTKCRDDKMVGKLLEYRENGKNHFMDQDTLNYVFKENVKYLSYKYNYLNKFHDWWGGERLSIFYGEVISKDKIDSFKNAVIIHLGSHEKPWIYNMGYLSRIYKKYYDNSPYNEEKLLLVDSSDSMEFLIDNSVGGSLHESTLLDQFVEDKQEKQYYENKYNKLKELLDDDELYVELEKKEQDISNIKNSTSFKVGRVITYVPRKLKGFFNK